MCQMNSTTLRSNMHGKCFVAFQCVTCNSTVSLVHHSSHTPVTSPTSLDSEFCSVPAYLAQAKQTKIEAQHASDGIVANAACAEFTLECPGVKMDGSATFQLLVRYEFVRTCHSTKTFIQLLQALRLKTTPASPDHSEACKCRYR